MFDLYKIDEEGVHYPSREAVQDRLAKSIAMDADGKIHASLIAMGWTPPHDHRDVNDAVRKAEANAGMWCVRDLDGALEGSGVPEMLADEVRRRIDAANDSELTNTAVRFAFVVIEVKLDRVADANTFPGIFVFVLLVFFVHDDSPVSVGIAFVTVRVRIG